jgi:hypothetical protein
VPNLWQGLLCRQYPELTCVGRRNYSARRADIDVREGEHQKRSRRPARRKPEAAPQVQYASFCPLTLGFGLVVGIAA